LIVDPQGLVVNPSIFFSLSQFIVKNDIKMNTRPLCSGQRLKQANGIEKEGRKWFFTVVFKLFISFP